jgi:alpha-1,3-mannosyltransferase
MRIVHVVRQFHPAVGGLENVVALLAAAQLSKGHRVRVVTLDRIFNAPEAGSLPKHEALGRLEIVRVPYFGSSRYPLAFSAIRHIRDADIVHVHGIDFFFDYLAWTAPFHRRKLVVSTHGGFFHTSFAARLKRFYFHAVTRPTLSWYAGVAAVSGADAELFRTIRRRGLSLIENGADIEKYADASSPVPRKSLIALGRFSSNKRLHHAISFLAALCRLDPTWTLTIAGRSSDVSADALRKFAADTGSMHHVRVVEAPSDQQVRALMADSSVLVSPSAYEGFGLVFAEALSAGLWPVVSPIPAFRRLVERTRLGTIVDFDDADVAARRFLADWLNVASRYDRIRRTAMAAAEEFRWSAASAKYETLYESALGQKVRSILDVPILAATSAQAIDLLDRQFEAGRPGVVVFANAHTLNATAADSRVRSLLDRSIVFNDGVGVDIASRLLFGRSFPENLNGTDFLPRFLRQTRHRCRIFLLGAKPGVAAKAAERLAALAPGHEIVGACHGYFAEEHTAQVVDGIRRARADILLVAMGNPQQETWLHQHLPATGCRLGFGVGALFDFLADVVPRAPVWVQRARLEWAYRLMQEPQRLWRRYLVHMPVFLIRVLRQWLVGARVPRALSQ